MFGGSCWRVALVVLMAAVLSGPVPYTAPSGDLNLDGAADVVDLQCLIQTYNLATAAGFPEEDQCQIDEDCLALDPDWYCRPGLNKQKVCLHQCLHEDVGLYPDPGIVCDPEEEENDACLGVTQKKIADMNCDGFIGNEDFNFLVQVIMKQTGGLDTADLDGDGQLNYCDDDMDGDGDPNATDCAPADASFSAFAPELCDGLDNDCDDILDEDLGETTCGVSICEHSVPYCVDGQVNDCDPMVGAEPEVCNGIDDSCTGKVDDGADVELCSDFQFTPNLEMVICQDGKCIASACDPGYYDMNVDASDGCECADDPNEKGNSSCGTPLHAGDLADTGNGTLKAISGNDPDDSGDWFSFYAQDVTESGTDSFHVRVKFTENPNNAYRFDLYWSSCAANHMICNGATDGEWFTDFFSGGGTQPLPAVPGPDTNGGGELKCAADPDHSITPTNYGDDTSAGSHQCKDNSKLFMLFVYLAPGATPICDHYKIEISNGVY